ncbi:SNF2 superfamily chromatin remodeling protein [Peniophora sp. CONT]|nr:SNF2 superfamily chromatin remodeling protein [Peniophora sp. CONT]
MSSRLDRLLLLLDTGSNSSVRSTAAKQLAQLAAKSVISDVAVEEDVKSHRLHALGDPSAWNELMSVVARVLPYLHSKSYDTRSAATSALSQIFSLVPVWHPYHDELADAVKEELDDANVDSPPEFPTVSVQELCSVQTDKLLVGSSGKEFIKPPVLTSAADVKKARKEAMGRLGLDFLDDDDLDLDMDLDKELGANDQPEETNGHDHDNGLHIKTDIPPSDDPFENNSPLTPIDTKVPSTKEPSPVDRSKSSTPAIPNPPSPSASVGDDLAGLSARERNRLKRKRKVGNSAFVAAPPPQASSSRYAAVPVGNKARVIAKEDKPTASSSRLTSPPAGTDKVVVDPTKGGAVSPKSEKQMQALRVQPGVWVWDGLVKVLEVDLFSPAWEVRHGASMALRELLKIQGAHAGMRAGLSRTVNARAHEAWCNALAAKLLCLFVLDRFSDYGGDQVVSPVRETTSQTLAALLLHMPRRSVRHVHGIFLQMIRQDFPIPSHAFMQPAGRAPPPVKGKRGRKAAADASKTKHLWQVRHAGLLGLQYEMAVRSDIFTEGKEEQTESSSVKMEVDEPTSLSLGTGQQILQEVVDCAMLGLGDGDDDVRSSAASCLLPIVSHIVNSLESTLPLLLSVLWNCLSSMKDDLSSSVGVVMDLLGKLVSYDKVIAVLASSTTSQPLTALAPTLFPFFRHTIVSVRLAVVETLHSFMHVTSLPKDWINAHFLQLLFQNLIVEERTDIRIATSTAWRTALNILAAQPDWLQNTVTPQLRLDWFSLTMTPIGAPLDQTVFLDPNADADADSVAVAERHNVDKNMIAQDLTLISQDIVWLSRIAASNALAYLLFLWSPPGEALEEAFPPLLTHYAKSSSVLQRVLTAIITEQWARESEDASPSAAPLVETSQLARTMAELALEVLQAEPPPAYYEMGAALHTLSVECRALLDGFHRDCKIPVGSIPQLAAHIDLSGEDPNAFTLVTAEATVGQIFQSLKTSLGRTQKKPLAVLEEKRRAVAASIERYKTAKTSEHDVRVAAAFAAAFVALRSTPNKVSPIVKGIMNGIKMEENLHLQTRSAVAVARFIDFCAAHSLAQPPDKIVKNLSTFLCQDVERTPTFAQHRKTMDGILSFTSAHKAQENGAATTPADEVRLDKSRISRRGARLAFEQLSARFTAQLLDTVPNMWPSMAGGLQSACELESVEAMDESIEKQHGQDVIDSLSVLEAVIPTLHADLWAKVNELFPAVGRALRSKFAIIRQAAARCFAAMCDVMTVSAMHFVIDEILPYLGDTTVSANRQGACELVYNVVQRLDYKALPYVIFLVVPILGRMSDPDDDIRSTATNTFATLVKMVPLEAGMPDPEGFSEQMLARREAERQFLLQLLDGSKVEQYKIPVDIKAELRKYQQDGINWLAFLAKYQLHGILCDDMGLGKTLQSICILASKHFERNERYKETKSPDAKHLPSIIVCPPTLTGHWFYEIKKYSDNLRPVMYVGNARERQRIASRLKDYDVVITSYEVVRNDIATLQNKSWLYCILDEGHVIKNARTKLTKAVKCIKANHRLILSGTPIQNNVLELWSLFDFLMPGFLGSEAYFAEKFSKPILSNRDGKSKNGEAAALALEALHKQVLPFLLRRLKEDVLHDLPPKIIQDYFCELSDLQKTLYDEFSRSQARENAEEAVKSEGKKQHVFQSLQYLRKLCNHPALVLKSPTDVKEALKKVGQSDPKAMSDIVHAPKLLALRQLLVDCGIGGPSSLHSGDGGKSELADADSSSSGAFSQHRVLIFCQMKQMLDIIETDLFKKHMPAVTYMRLDGGTDANKRHNVVQTFNADPSIDCLLLTTHVGGLGLTLTGADTVIFVEHDWNPMKDLQAMDRAHRLGQKKVVNVYRLITKGTLEEKIMGLQRFKLNIANSVVTQQNSGLASMDTDLVLDLFKHTSADEEAAAAKKDKLAVDAPPGAKNILQGLEDLPTEEEYQDLELSSFMSSLTG